MGGGNWAPGNPPAWCHGGGGTPLKKPIVKPASSRMSVTYIALLRGMNVGGKNKLPMKDLIEMFVEAGCADVRTYIQGGNVIFSAAQLLRTGQLKAAAEVVSARRCLFSICA